MNPIDLNGDGDEENVYEAEDVEMDPIDLNGDGNVAKFKPEEILEYLKKRLKELDAEAAFLRETQAKLESAITAAAYQDPGSANETQAAKIEADSRTIYVVNVDHACTPEEIQQHFQTCGTVNRVTILSDKFGQPKGLAYVEFMEIDAIQNAVLLNKSVLHGRQLKVAAKRANVPGMRQHRARQPSPYFYPPFT